MNSRNPLLNFDPSFGIHDGLITLKFCSDFASFALNAFRDMLFVMLFLYFFSLALNCPLLVKMSIRNVISSSKHFCKHTLKARERNPLKMPIVKDGQTFGFGLICIFVIAVFYKLSVLIYWLGWLLQLNSKN